MQTFELYVAFDAAGHVGATSKDHATALQSLFEENPKASGDVMMTVLVCQPKFDPATGKVTLEVVP